MEVISPGPILAAYYLVALFILYIRTRNGSKSVVVVLTLILLPVALALIVAVESSFSFSPNSLYAGLAAGISIAISRTIGDRYWIGTLCTRLMKLEYLRSNGEEYIYTRYEPIFQREFVRVIVVSLCFSLLTLIILQFASSVEIAVALIASFTSFATYTVLNSTFSTRLLQMDGSGEYALVLDNMSHEPEPTNEILNRLPVDWEPGTLHSKLDYLESKEMVHSKTIGGQEVWWKQIID
jgi:uncharacterized membrane protein YeiB